MEENEGKRRSIAKRIEKQGDIPTAMPQCGHFSVNTSLSEQVTSLHRSSPSIAAKSFSKLKYQREAEGLVCMRMFRRSKGQNPAEAIDAWS